MSSLPMSKCACRRTDPYDCWRMRYGYDMDDHDVEADGGPCECSCHGGDDDELDAK